MPTHQILPDLILPSRADQHFEYTGMDSIEKCRNKKHFLTYPHKINYTYNNRGFRDTEWPTSKQELQDAIWCVGDSFTAGIGQPFHHIWPQVLSTATQKRTINVSMDGASNNWIARRARDIIETVNPKHMIIMWSYVERREMIKDHLWRRIYQDIRDPSWPECNCVSDIDFLPVEVKLEITKVHNIKLPYNPNDDELIYQDARSDVQAHYSNWECCINLVRQYRGIIHSVIPRFVPDTNLKNVFWQYLEDSTHQHIDPFHQLDWARDGHHFDILTAQHVVSNLIRYL